MALRVRKNRVTFPEGIQPPRGAGPHACPLNRAMDLLAGAWAPHVVWYLSAQPRRFGELRKDLPAISARVLSQRLRELEARGLVSHHEVTSSTPPSHEYALTPLGERFMPVIEAIIEVGKHLDPVAPQ
jgi:DNA-binding HxlR family transcriptional regulator